MACFWKWVMNEQHQQLFKNTKKAFLPATIAIGYGDQSISTSMQIPKSSSTTT